MMNVEFFFALLIIAGVQSFPLFANFKFSGRIVGGYEIDIRNRSFQISLQEFGEHYCGGSLISEKFVLTAAHCVYARHASLLKVRIGSAKKNSGGVLVGVKKIFRHSKFSQVNMHNDIALLELNGYNQTTLTFGYVNLPKLRDQIADGEKLCVSGWGYTKNRYEPTDKLRAVNVQKLNQKTCNESYKDFGGITSRMFCAGLVAGGKDSCNGDSGGPLTFGNILVGIVSWGLGCALPHYPGVYTHIASYRMWIKAISGI